MTSSSSPSVDKPSLGALIALVVGSMIGSGIFALPLSFGAATGGFGAMIAWSIAGVGMLMLAFVFQTLSRRRPDLDTGIYAYAKPMRKKALATIPVFTRWDVSAGIHVEGVMKFVSPRSEQL